MQTKPKANSIITHRLTDAGNIEFLFRGQSVGMLYMQDMHPTIRERAAIHGMVQRIGDGGAVERKAPDGTLRTDAEMDGIKRYRMECLIAHYNSGTDQWNLQRAGGGGVDTSGLTIAGIMRALGCDTDAAERKVAAYMTKHGLERKATLTKLAVIPEVATAIAAIKAERAGDAPSLDDLDD